MITKTPAARTAKHTQRGNDLNDQHMNTRIKPEKRIIMSDLMNSTVTVAKLFGIIGVVCTVGLGGTTLYWQAEMREALEQQDYQRERIEFQDMKLQLSRIEATVITLSATVRAYHVEAKDWENERNK